jgi:putative oxidoreductase
VLIYERGGLNDRALAETKMALSNEPSSHRALSYADGLAESSGDILLLIGRVMLGWIFVRSGYGKLFTVDAVANSFPLRGIPGFMAYIAVPFEFFGGIALILGLATRYVTLGFVIFMLVATLASHRYWEFTDAAARRVQDSSFYKNTAMLGGILFLFVWGSGRLALDNWLRKRN